MKQLSILCLIIMVSCQTNQDHTQAKIQIDTVSLARHMEALASDDFQGRKPFTVGEVKTVDYLETQFKLLGLSPGNGGSYRQEVSMIEITSRAESQMKVISKNETIFLDLSTDFVAKTEQDLVEVALKNSEVVFAGFGIIAPEYGWDDYKGIDVTGKTVLVLVNDPGFNSGDPDFFKGQEMTYYGRWTYKYEEAARQGAAAVFIVHETAAAGYPWSVLQHSGANLTLDDPSAMNTCPIQGWISSQAALKLFKNADMDFNQWFKNSKTRTFQATNLDLKLSFGLENSIKRAVSSNVIAKIVGSEFPEEVIIYSAHWDHLGIGIAIDDDSIYNGAQDNASGTAMILALAAAFKKEKEVKRTLVFLALTAEEEGLLGSAFYARHPIYEPSKSVANINIDALASYGKMKDLTIMGFGQSELDDLAEKIARRQGRYVYPDPYPNKGLFFRSDHFNFAKIGIPAFFAYASFDAVNGGKEIIKKEYDQFYAQRYHAPSDEFNRDTWQFGAMQQDGDLFYQMGLELANNRIWPKWNQGSEFKIIREMK